MKNTIPVRVLLLSLPLGVTLALVAMTPLTVYAQDDQSPNWQVTSSNTQTEPGSPFDRFSIYTSTPFHGSNPYFTYQMNSVVNGCTGFPIPCSGTYWMQGIIGLDAGSAISQPNGWYVHDAHIELVWGPANGNCGAEGNCASICKPSIPQLVNINLSNYNAYDQINIDPTSSTPLTLSVIVSNQNTGHVFYGVSASCQIPSGATLVNYFTQLEGVIVGTDGTWSYQTFSPTHTNLFFGYIDMLSSFNLMSNAKLTTQTAEGSNLYQVPAACYGTTYNGYHLYTVQSDENTYGPVGSSCP
ncbi:MAG TPA: hypothetical protein VJN71_03295 [Nitrososphaerales archaeon]|nr:hypothetical protein [Nitrososphaerales archaeon]